MTDSPFKDIGYYVRIEIRKSGGNNRHGDGGSNQIVVLTCKSIKVDEEWEGVEVKDSPPDNLIVSMTGLKSKVVF